MFTDLFEVVAHVRRLGALFCRYPLTRKPLLGETKARLAKSLDAAPEALKPEIRTELDEVDRMDVMTYEVGSAHMSKMSRESYHRGSRKRGRTVRRETDEEI